MHPKKLSSKSMDMTTGSTWKLLLSFAVPLLIGNLFQQLYNTVDSLVVGNFVGTEALAAVGSTTSIINTMVMFFNGTSIGASVIISRHYGAHDDKKLHLAVETTIMVTFLASILFTVLGISWPPSCSGSCPRQTTSWSQPRCISGSIFPVSPACWSIIWEAPCSGPWAIRNGRCCSSAFPVSSIQCWTWYS